MSRQVQTGPVNWYRLLGGITHAEKYYENASNMYKQTNTMLMKQEHFKNGQRPKNCHFLGLCEKTLMILLLKK